MFFTFSDVEEYLDKKGLFHMDLSLDRMKDVLSQTKLYHPAPCVIQILGTNGKGSTAAFLTSLFQSHGLRVGLYTSPHFVSIRERVQIAHGGKDHCSLIDTKLWIGAANSFLPFDKGLTYFEYITLLALFFFRVYRVDVIVLEAGLGGAHDATTAVQRDYLCYTPIALDHRNVLGNSLEAIATDKSLAIGDGMQVFTQKQYPLALHCLEKTAKSHGIPLHNAEPLPKQLCDAVSLSGKHQLANAGLALTLFKTVQKKMGFFSSNDACAKGLANAFLPGRLQSIQASKTYPHLLLDGAHNPHGIQTVLESLRTMGVRPSALVYAALRDKDWKSSVRLLKQSFPSVPVVFPALSNERAQNPEEIEKVWSSQGQGSVLHLKTRNANVATLLKALQKHPARVESGPVLLLGSLYLLSEFYKAYPKNLRK
ncbi:MAG: bifunctional folylpolyglutamate synthase/ dihydrofolate synthase [Desulfovibrio sp.]|nr:bifunctional folylpolyglutamate synthase/ dihydrofolate synthase [Desulfovibrio sp.]